MNDINIEKINGFVTQNNVRGEYTAYLVRDEEILYEVKFNIADQIETFPGPECFDENMVLDESLCPDAFSAREVENPYFRLQLPLIQEAERLEIYQGGELISSIKLSNRSNISWLYYAAGILIILVIGTFLGKYYKKRKLNNQKVI